MRDRALAEAIRRLAADAAASLSALLAAGDQIPFDVAEDSGEHSLFYRYVPLTSTFIAEREDELRCLPSFREARQAVEESGAAAPYLEAHGEAVPAEPNARAERMLLVFLSRLWDGCAELSLDRARLDHALLSLEAQTRDLERTDLLIAPVVGLRMPLERLQLPSGVRVVTASAVEIPPELRRSDGMARAPWETQFVAIAENGEGAEGPTAALGQLRDLISVLRLFKEGGVGLGPHAFAPTGEGEWQRFATLAPPPRSGGYTLTETEASRLAGFAKRLEARPDAAGPLAWAVERFEMGCARPDALQGLTDHLLAARSLLEGGGHVGAPLPVRAAALFAGPSEREGVRERIAHAIALESAVAHGSLPGGPESGSAIGLALWFEDAVRTILRDAALGLLGGDVSAAADEILVAHGLQAGGPAEVQSGETSEWEATTDDEEDSMRQTDAGRDDEQGTQDEDGITRVMEPIPAEEGEIRVTAASAECENDDLFEEYADLNRAIPESDDVGAPAASKGSAPPEGDWLSEISADSGGTLEWPAPEIRRTDAEREPIDTPRVRHLFPVPDNSGDWSVPELDYHRRNAGGGY